MHLQKFKGPEVALAVSRSMWWQQTCMPKWEHICTTGCYDVIDCYAQTWKGAWWLSQKHNLRAGNWQSKSQHVEAREEMLIFQLVQLGFSRSLGIMTSNEAYKSAMWLCSVWPKWNIDILSHNAASRTQFSQLQLTSYHNMSNLHNIKTNRWHIVGFQHGHCSRLDRGNFKITLNIKKAPTPNFQINHFLLCPKCWKVEWGMIAKYAAGLSIPQICSLDMPLGRQWFIHMMAYIAKSLCLMLCCLFFYAISVVSLRDYQCHRPVRVISSAAQAAAVVPPVCRHGEMLRL